MHHIGMRNKNEKWKISLVTSWKKNDVFRNKKKLRALLHITEDY